MHSRASIAHTHTHTDAKAQQIAHDSAILPALNLCLHRTGGTTECAHPDIDKALRVFLAVILPSLPAYHFIKTASTKMARDQSSGLAERRCHQRRDAMEEIVADS